MHSEEWVWIRLALRMGVPLQQLKRMTTSREFVLYKKFLREEANEQTPLFWYLAAIRKDINATVAKNPRALKAKEHLLKFEFQEGTVNDAESNFDSEEMRLKMQKSRFFQYVGYHHYQQKDKTGKFDRPLRIMKRSPRVNSNTKPSNNHSRGRSKHDPV